MACSPLGDLIYYALLTLVGVTVGGGAAYSVGRLIDYPLSEWLGKYGIWC